MSRPGDLSAYTISYDSRSHWKVLIQRRGSIGPVILPYCISNVCLMIVLIIIDRRFDLKESIAVSAVGPTFITMIISFLMVTRVNMGLNRYDEARGHLESMCRESRELIQNACALSGDDIDQAAKEWRNELAYRCLLLLRTSMAVIDYPTTKIPAWEVPELEGAELTDIRQSVFVTPGLRRWAHSERSEWEETMRVPIRVAYLLRKSIHSQSKRLKTVIAVVQENKMLDNVDGFLKGYYGMRKFLTTPTPFSLVQMARDFLFLYVYSFPFVMLSDNSNAVARCWAVLLLTYGFTGLSEISLQLENPFGNDPNDFDNSALAQTAYEDTYLTILDVDGSEWADNLRYRMHDKSSEPLPTEQSWLLAKGV